MKYCDKCNKTLSDEFKHCPECGNKLGTFIKSEDSKSSSNIKSQIFNKKISISVIVVLILLAFGYAFTGMISLVGQTETDVCANVKSASNISQEGITILIGGKKCVTDKSGMCCLGKFKANESYDMMISGSGIETRKESFMLPIQSQPYYYEISLTVGYPISFSVSDKDTGEVLDNAKIYLDNRFKGATSGGILNVQLVPEGQHSVKLEYEGVSSSESIAVNSMNTKFSLGISVPKKVIVKLTDSESNKEVENIQVYLDEEAKGVTGSDGSLTITEVMPGTHSIRLVIPYKDDVTQTFTVKGDTDVPINVKMPKPDIVISFVPGQHRWQDWTKMCVQDFEITISNLGDGPAENVNFIAALISEVNKSSLVYKSRYPPEPLGRLEPGDDRAFNRTYDIDATLFCVEPTSLVAVAVYIKENKYAQLFAPVDPWQVQLVKDVTEFGIKTSMQLAKIALLE